MISDSLWSIISNINGSISFCASFISLFPQIIETYHDKTVAGLSPYFLLCWLLGDITSLIGALMTNQLMFQILLAVYFLFNDLFVCGQYYYYGIIHKNKLATVGHETVPVLSQVNNNNNNNNNKREDENDNGNDSIQPRPQTNGANANETSTSSSTTTTTTNNNTMRNTQLVTGLVTVASNTVTMAAAAMRFEGANTVPSSSALLLLSQPNPVGNNTNTNNNNNNNNIHKIMYSDPTSIGIILSWIGASFYVGARIPQLIKNYQRKSTDGLSPFLFATTLLGNVTYNISILTSLSFIHSDDKIDFLRRAAPFLFGSAGTIIFDLIYFYQYYVLYAEDKKLRTLERELLSPRVTEETPLLS